MPGLPVHSRLIDAEPNPIMACAEPSDIQVLGRGPQPSALAGAANAKRNTSGGSGHKKTSQTVII